MEKLFACLVLLVASVLIVPGCFAEESPMTGDVKATTFIETTKDTGEASGANVTTKIDTVAGNTTYTADVNLTSLVMAVNDTVRVSLKENPTTGFMWNVTNSTGLAIINDTYVIDAAPEGMVGVGGVHEWILKAVEAGNQTFSAIYMRSFENLTGDEDNYTLNVTVE